MKNQDFVLRFDAKHRVLQLTAGKQLTDDIYMGLYHVIKRFVAAQGPCSAIFDFSLVEAFDLSNKLLRQIGEMEPAVPAAMGRIVVAPQDVIYGASRIVETLRSETAAAIKIVRAIDEAYAAFGAVAADFVTVEPI